MPEPVSVHFRARASIIWETISLVPLHLDSSVFSETSTALEQNREKLGWLTHSPTQSNPANSHVEWGWRGSRVSTQTPGSSSGHSPFWVSFVEQTRVEIWKESLLMVQLPRFCMLLPVAECPFSSSSILVDGRLR